MRIGGQCRSGTKTQTRRKRYDLVRYLLHFASPFYFSEHEPMIALGCRLIVIRPVASDMASVHTPCRMVATSLRNAGIIPLIESAIRFLNLKKYKGLGLNPRLAKALASHIFL
jgi:hypothetical protein